jgi:hypothetical protein
MLKGNVTIKVKEYDKDNILQTVNIIKQDNTVCVRALEQLITTPTIGVFNNSTNFRIVISSTNLAPSFSFRTLANTLASGDKTPFIDNFIYSKRDILSTSNPSDVIYKQRFVAPTVSRTINSIGLSDNITLQNNVVVTSNIFTYLKLNTPIVQTNTQTLDISYRVSIDWTNAITAELHPNVAGLYELILFNPTNSVGPNFMAANKINTKYFNANVGINFAANVAAGIVGGNQLIATTTTTTNSLLTTTASLNNTNITLNPAADQSNFLGRFISHYATMCILSNYATDKPFTNQGFVNKTGNLSDVTSHNILSTLAIYDTNNLANASWKPTITDGSSPDFPSVYVLKVSESGGLGTGKYKIYKTGWGGWFKGQWANAIADPFLSADFCYLQHQIIVSDPYDTYNPRWLYYWNSTLGNESMVSYTRNKGVAIYTLTDRNLILNNKWSINTNGLGFYIYDVAAAPAINKIYIAMDNGLHEINVTTNTITQLNNDKCLAVTVGFNNEVFAIFNPSGTSGRLSGSIGTNWGTALSLGTTPPTINWSNIWRIYIDSKNANYELMIIEGTVPVGTVAAVSGTATRFIRHWWSNSIGIQRTDIISTIGNVSVSRRSVYSDLIMFPSHNSVIAENGIWIYANEFFLDWAIADQACKNVANDLETDLINSNIYFNRYIGFATVRGSVNKGNASGLDFTSPSLLHRFLNKVKIGIGLFAQAPINSFFASSTGCSDWIKPRRSNETNVFSVVFTMSNHTTTADYFASTANTQNTLAATPPATLSRIQDLTFNASVGVNYTNNRMGLFVKVDFNLTGPTLEANIVDYTDIGSANTYALVSNQCSQIANIKVTHDKRIVLFDEISTLAGAGIRMYSPIHVPVNDLSDILCQAWSWNSTTSQWEPDDLNINPGKPLHTSTDPLVDGLSISWTDLQPGNSKNLVLGQYYIFTRTTTPNMVPIENHTPLLNFSSSLQLRQFLQGNTSITIPNTTATFVVKEAPTGTNPNANWYGINTTPSTNSNHTISATINGVSAPITFSAVTSPSLGSIVINENGRIRINSGDVNKALILNYSIALKYSPDEAAVL